jgi:hypothetical protein
VKILASLGLLIAITVLITKLALSPFYARYDAEECRAAYARARTLADSLRVDLHPYASRLRGRNPRCGEVRGTFAESFPDAPPSRQPDEDM